MANENEIKEWAVYENSIILNIIIADSKESAEKLTGLYAEEVVNNRPQIGYEKNDGVWMPPKPYESWVWDGENWRAPVLCCPGENGPWQWDEDSQQWIPAPLPIEF